MRPPVVADHTSSDAEVFVFRALEGGVPDDVIALHSLGLGIHDRKPWAEADFVVVSPQGVFVLEVKGGRLRRENGLWIHTTRNGHDSQPEAEGPFAQVGSASSALHRYLSERLPAVRSSVVGYGVLTPDMKFAVEGPDIIREIVYDADDVAQPIGAYLDRLAAFWQNRITSTRGMSVRTLEPAQVEAIADELRGDFDGRLSVRARADRVNSEILRLTRQQYRVLDGLAENDRALISGGAGTGKTLLAIEEAIRHGRAGRRVLLLCYNRALADYLAKATRDEPNVRAVGMHAFLFDLIRRAGMENDLVGLQGDDLYDRAYPDVAFRAIYEGRVEDRYDVIVIDEGQDLLTDRYLDVLDGLLKGEMANGRWRIFLDPRQNLFDRHDLTALQRLKANAASYSLTMNCRNTRPIGITTSMLCGFELTETLVADGEDVTVRFWNDENDQWRQLGKDLNRYLSGGFGGGDLVVLGTRKLDASGVRPLEGQTFKLVEAHVEKGDRRNVRYSTVQAYKGLEADAVFVVGITDLQDPATVAMLYVATSRARTDLYLYLAESARPQYLERAAQLGARLASPA
jgi:hypothetical protein